MKQCLCKEIGQYSVETFLAVPIHGVAHMILFASIFPYPLTVEKGSNHISYLENISISLILHYITCLSTPQTLLGK